MKNTMMFGMGVLLLSSCSMMGMGAGPKDSTMTKDGAAMKDNAMADSSMAVKTPVVNQNTASYVLNRQPAATNIAPMGNVAVTVNSDKVTTTTKLTGMAPETYYVAHYHEQGTVPSTDPCASNGPAILPSMMVGLSDKGGNVMLMGSVAKSVVMKATYYNVHTAKNAAGEPADPGVTCSAVKM